MNQFILSSTPKTMVPNTSSITTPSVPSVQPFITGDRRATVDKFYFSAENFNVVMKLIQDLFRKEYHVILTKNDTIKGLLVRALASAKRKQPALTTIVEMNKAAVVEGLPSLQRQVQLHPDIHIHVPENEDLLNASNSDSQSYLDELNTPKVVLVDNSDIQNLESLVSQSAMLHINPPKPDTEIIKKNPPAAAPPRRNTENILSQFTAPSRTPVPQPEREIDVPSTSTALPFNQKMLVEVPNSLILNATPLDNFHVPTSTLKPVQATSDNEIVAKDLSTSGENGFDIMQNFQEMQRLKFSIQSLQSSDCESLYGSVPTSSVTNEVHSETPNTGKVQPIHIEVQVPPDIVPCNDILEEDNFEEMYTETLDSTRRDSLSFPVRPEYTHLQHFVDVSSVDRNFNVQEKFNRYSFAVTFQSEQRFFKPAPIFSNSPVIPIKTNNSSAVTLEPNPAYIPENNIGSIIGWYEVPSGISKGLNIPERVSNVTQLSIDSVLLYFSSMDAICADISDKSFGKTLLHYPYLLLQIKELVSVYKSTNSYYSHNVIKIVRDKTWSQATCGDGFHLFRPVGNEMFNFPTPIASLNRLTIRILNPMGNELCMQQETLLIKQLRITQINDPSNILNQIWVIEVTTTNFFAVCQFYTDHIVCFQDMIYYGSTTLSSFINWLQDSDGHRIIYTPSSTDPISNKFYIKYPVTVNWTNGNMMHMEFDEETILTLSSDSSGLKTCPLINGSVYNTTIQTHVGFNVLSRNMRSTFSSDNIRV